MRSCEELKAARRQTSGSTFRRRLFVLSEPQLDSQLFPDARRHQLSRLPPRAPRRHGVRQHRRVFVVGLGAVGGQRGISCISLTGVSTWRKAMRFYSQHPQGGLLQRLLLLPAGRRGGSEDKQGGVRHRHPSPPHHTSVPSFLSLFIVQQTPSIL